MLNVLVTGTLSITSFLSEYFLVFTDFLSDLIYRPYHSRNQSTYITLKTHKKSSRYHINCLAIPIIYSRTISKYIMVEHRISKDDNFFCAMRHDLFQTQR